MPRKPSFPPLPDQPILPTGKSAPEQQDFFDLIEAFWSDQEEPALPPTPAPAPSNTRRSKPR